MNKLIAIILLVCNNVIAQNIIENQKGSGYRAIGNYGNIGSGINWIGDRGQKYPGIWVGSDKNRREDNNDLRYDQNGDYFDNDRENNDRYDVQGEYFNNNGNKYGQGIRIGVNGYASNDIYDDIEVGGRRDRNQLLFNAGLRAAALNAGLRAGLGLNAGLRAGLGLNAGLRAGLGLNAGLRAALGLNAGLGLGGLSLGAGLRVGLDLSAGAEQDKQEDLVRPCQMEDYQCIRKFFAENSQCNPSYGPSPDPLYLDQNTLYLPYANLSYTLTNVKITGMSNAKISDLYINRVTGNVVLSIQIRDLNETSAKAYLSYKRPGKEPIILADASSILFSRLTLTVVLPRIPNLRLDLADISAYIDSGVPQYQLGQAAYTSKDPDVNAAYLQLAANLGLGSREGFLLQAQLLAALYIQLNICDFGVNLISV